ncbi:CVNH domain-containing protein [Morchella snyderi]|nr:CVNH domain-containing protein [Morchella snyderi]
MDCKAYRQTSVYINLSSRQELSALCRTCNGDWVRSTIDLNSILGNSDGISFPAHSRRPSAASNKTLVNAGTFDWTSMNFGASAKNVELQDGKVLSANLQRKDGTWTDKPVCVNLTEHIQNHDGILCRGEREESETTISPDVRDKLQAVAGLITSQQSAMDNAAFELDYLVTSNQRLVLQELEVAFLRLGKLAGCIRGEFDEEVKDGGVPKSNPDAVLRPMIRSFENVATRTEKALGLVEKIYQLANQHQMSGLPSLQRDVSSLKAEITTEVDGVQTTLSELQEKIKGSAAAVEASQALLKEAQATKEKANSMETLIKLSGWVLLPIGIGMNVANVDGPFWDAVKGNEAKIKELEEDAVKQQTELTSLTQKEADYHATLHAHDHLATQLDTLTVNIVAISSRAESVRETIAAIKRLMDALTEMARDLEDKGSMTDYQVSKKEYAAHIVCLLDMALPYFSAVGEVEKILVELEEGDDEKGSVKEDLKNEVAVVRGKLELVKLCV